MHEWYGRPNARHPVCRSTPRLPKPWVDSENTRNSLIRYKTLALGNVMTVAERQERRERDTGTKRMQKAQMRAGMRNNKSEMTQHYREQDMQW